MKLSLHIGTEKTGTKTIQLFLDSNESALSSCGICTSRALGINKNSFILPYKAGSLDDAKSLKHWPGSKKQFLKYLDNAWSSFLVELESSKRLNCHHWIISSELLHSRLVHNTQLLTLKNLLTSLFTEVVIVLYLRKPIDAAVSLWNTALLEGADMPHLPSPETKAWNHLCNHKASIQLWRSVFNDCDFKIRLFDDAHFHGGGLITDFCAQIGIPLQSNNFFIPQHINKSISGLATELICQLNKHNYCDPSLRTLIAEQLSGLPKYIPSAHDAAAYDQAFSDSDRWLLANFFQDKSQLWLTAKSCSTENDKAHEDHNTRLEEVVFISQMIQKVWTTKRPLILLVKLEKYLLSLVKPYILSNRFLFNLQFVAIDFVRYISSPIKANLLQ